MADYSKMTMDDFSRHLEARVGELTAAEIMTIPGVYAVLSEELNNDVLDAWADENPEKAWPDGRPEEEEK